MNKVYYEIYKGNKTYMFNSGALADREAVLRSYPAIETFPHIVGTDATGTIFGSLESLAGAMQRFGVSKGSMTDDEVCEVIESLENKRIENEIKAQEEAMALAAEQEAATLAVLEEQAALQARLVAATEFQAMLLLSDTE